MGSFNFIFITIILLIYLWYAFSIVYHLSRFGVGRKPKILALVFFLGSFLLFLITFWSYQKVDWALVIKTILEKLNFIS